MFFKLFIFFTVVPILELYFLIKIGGAIGAFNTIVIILLTATIGAWLARAQGFMVLRRIQESLGQGRVPGHDILQGLFVLVGAFALLTPGFLTDMIGLSMLIPSVRAIYIKLLGLYIKNRIDSGVWVRIDRDTHYHF